MEVYDLTQLGSRERDYQYSFPFSWYFDDYVPLKCYYVKQRKGRGILVYIGLQSCFHSYCPNISILTFCIGHNSSCLFRINIRGKFEKDIALELSDTLRHLGESFLHVKLKNVNLSWEFVQKRIVFICAFGIVYFSEELAALRAERDLI